MERRVCETSFFYPSGSDLDAALGAIWVFPRIVAGPVTSRNSEPADQTTVEPNAASGELDGVLALPDGAETICATFSYHWDDGDQVTFSLPLGSLEQVWPNVGSYPFSVTEAQAAAWEPALESVLFELAEHLYDRAPFLRGLTDFESLYVEYQPELERPGPIPPEHGAGIIDVQQGRLVWHPPTSRRSFEFPVHKRETQVEVGRSRYRFRTAPISVLVAGSHATSDCLKERVPKRLVEGLGQPEREEAGGCIPAP